MNPTNPLLAPMAGGETRDIGGVHVDTFRAGNGRVKRMIYPPGFNWELHLKQAVGTDLCTHAHVGFLAHGEIHVRFVDGCVEEFKAPQFVAVQPGHEGWVVGTEPAVLIEFDFESDTVEKLGVPTTHHAGQPHERFTEGSGLPVPPGKYPFTK
jgi:hypothetical protein